MAVFCQLKRTEVIQSEDRKQSRSVCRRHWFVSLRIFTTTMIHSDSDASEAACAGMFGPNVQISKSDPVTGGNGWDGSVLLKPDNTAATCQGKQLEVWRGAVNDAAFTPSQTQSGVQSLHYTLHKQCVDERVHTPPALILQVSWI